MVEINRDWFTIFTSVAVIKELYHTHITTFYFTQLGRKERYFDKFVVSPDNQLLAFLGKDGYIPLVSNKVQHSWSLCKRLWLCHNFGLNFCTVCLLLGLFVCLSVCLSVCLCVCLCVCLVSRRSSGWQIWRWMGQWEMLLLLPTANTCFLLEVRLPYIALSPGNGRVYAYM